MPWFECTECESRIFDADDIEGDNCPKCGGGYLIGIDEEDVENNEDED